MSYFTETFESILEFKNSIDARDLRDKVSGDHTYAASKKVLGKSTYNDMMVGGAADGRGEDVRNMREKRDYDAASRATKNAVNGKRSAVISKSNAMNRDTESGKYGAYGKRVAQRSNAEVEKITSKIKHESYDPVYEDLCRMGIID